MSASEQEVRSQIAEMREALQSARASARTGKIIGVLGVLVGLAIVAIYVVLFIGLGKSVVKSDELPRVLRARVERLQLDRAVSQIIEEAAPAYLAEARTLVEDLELPKLASEELQLMMKDLEPVLRQELERVRPQLQIVLENQREQTLNAVEGMLQQKLNARLQTIISRQGQRISEEQGLDEATLQMVATNLVDASGEAFRGMIEKRKGNLQEELAEMQKLLDQVPPLGEDKQEVILEDLGKVLVALLKHRLPEYVFEPDELRPPGRVVPVEARELMEKAREEAAAARAAEAAKPRAEIPPEVQAEIDRVLERFAKGEEAEADLSNVPPEFREQVKAAIEAGRASRARAQEAAEEPVREVAPQPTPGAPPLTAPEEVERIRKEAARKAAEAAAKRGAPEGVGQPQVPTEEEIEAAKQRAIEAAKAEPQQPAAGPPAPDPDLQKRMEEGRRKAQEAAEEGARKAEEAAQEGGQ